jgi:chromosome partitioning protein
MTTWFNVITLATPKGGTGKSTLSRGLAAYWFALGRKPALVDADPTETLAKRYNPTGPLGGVPVIAEPEERVGEVIEELRGRHAPVIVDTAGFRNRTNITALVATDLALIPLKPAIEDVDAAVATYGLIEEINATPERAGRPIRTAMVLTMTLRGTVIARHVRSQLESAGYPLLKAEMPHRVAYPEAGIDGLSPSVVEPDGAAARDIAAIVHEIIKLANNEIMNPFRVGKDGRRMRSKQLGALLNTVPPATARPTAPVAAAQSPAAAPPPPTAPLRNGKEVPLQVLIPEHVREQLGIMAAKERASLRALILRAVRGLGIEVTDEEIRDKRGRRSS